MERKKESVPPINSQITRRIFVKNVGGTFSATDLKIFLYDYKNLVTAAARSWFSGKIIASHAMASGSIPEGRILFWTGNVISTYY